MILEYPSTDGRSLSADPMEFTLMLVMVYLSISVSLQWTVVLRFLGRKYIIIFILEMDEFV